jgi:hypothetical protein
MRDKSLSIAARGLLALLMTYSDDWMFIVPKLQEVCGVGRDKMRSMLSELEDAGYLVREAVRGECGRLDGSTWVILDDPDGASFSGQRNGSPQDDVPEVDHRPPENPAVGATDPLKNRPPVKPTAGKSVPIRRPTYKKTNTKNPPAPPAGEPAGFGVGCETEFDLGDDVPCLKSGHGTETGPVTQPCLKNAQSCDQFDRFWGAYPEPVERDAARKAFAAVLADGEISAEQLVVAAQRYARSRHVEKGYAMKPANWLSRGSWREEWEAGRAAKSEASVGKVDLDALADRWVTPIKSGQTWVASAVSASLARHMLGKGLVSEAELRRVGVAF